MLRRSVLMILLCAITATAFAQAGSVRLSGWRVNYSAVQEKKGLLHLQKPNVELYSMMGFGVLEFPSLVGTPSCWRAVSTGTTSFSLFQSAQVKSWYSFGASGL